MARNTSSSPRVAESILRAALQEHWHIAAQAPFKQLSSECDLNLLVTAHKHEGDHHASHQQVRGVELGRCSRITWLEYARARVSAQDLQFKRRRRNSRHAKQGKLAAYAQFSPTLEP